MRNPAELIQAFCDLLEKEQNERVAKQHAILHENAIKEGRRGYVHVSYTVGGRFFKVIRESGAQGSVAYFVDRSNGVIFGAKGWNAYNPIHEYGTLETIDEWSWGDYYGQHKEGKSSMVPKGQRR